jgi:dolichol-phosphate mannosyltransferase
MVPLRIAAYTSLTLLLILLGGLVYTVAAYVFSDTVRGWTSLTFLILLISAIQLGTLAVLGEYVGRIYMTSKQRPLFLIDEIRRAAGGEKLGSIPAGMPTVTESKR